MTQIWKHAGFDHHEMVLFCHDKAAGLNAIIATQNTALGLAMGGCRVDSYSSEEEAAQGVLRLSRGVTYKYAVSGLDFGGAKTVIIGDPSRDKSPALLAPFGGILERLAEQYTTAEDAGIDTADVHCMATETRYARNLPLDNIGERSLGTAVRAIRCMHFRLRHFLRHCLRRLAMVHP